MTFLSTVREKVGGEKDEVRERRGGGGKEREREKKPFKNSFQYRVDRYNFIFFFQDILVLDVQWKKVGNDF